MIDFFFNINFVSLTQMLVKIFFFLFLSIAKLYVIYFIFTKILFRESKHRKEINLRLTFLWSIFAYLILFNIYLWALFYKNGTNMLQLTNPLFYLGLFAQISVYIALLVLFFSKRRALLRIINDKSIN